MVYQWQQFTLRFALFVANHQRNITFRAINSSMVMFHTSLEHRLSVHTKIVFQMTSARCTFFDAHKINKRRFQVQFFAELRINYNQKNHLGHWSKVHAVYRKIPFSNQLLIGPKISSHFFFFTANHVSRVQSSCLLRKWTGNRYRLIVHKDIIFTRNYSVFLHGRKCGKWSC